MLRGSRPGERRGGRKLDTPNRRTVLTDRILSIGSDHPTASRHSLLLKLVKDQKLPADTRMAVAPKCFPAKRTQSGGTRRPRVSVGILSSVGQGTGAKVGSVGASKGPQSAASVPATQDWNPQVLDALFGIVQDLTADFKARRKAALKIAEFLLPKTAKKAKALPDEYGFAINPDLARKYRHLRRELVFLQVGRMRNIPAVVQKIEELTVRVNAIRRRLPLPSPSKYGIRESQRDLTRLEELAELRGNGAGLTESEAAEEAHLWARLDTFRHSPEQTARSRLKALEDTERRFEMGHRNGYSGAPPLTPKDRDELELLRRLYPEPISNPSHSGSDESEMFHGHPH